MGQIIPSENEKEMNRVSVSENENENENGNKYEYEYERIDKKYTEASFQISLLREIMIRIHLG